MDNSDILAIIDFSLVLIGLIFFVVTTIKGHRDDKKQTKPDLL